LSNDDRNQEKPLDFWRRRCSGQHPITRAPRPCDARRKLFDPSIQPLIPLPLFRKVPNYPELNLYSEVVFGAVRLVRGEGLVAKTKLADVEAARRWIMVGDAGMVTFDACCGWLGWDAEHTRQAIFSTVRAA
jgi:hypothetical protein